MILNELWVELLDKEGTRWGRVISDSMRPVITRGDRVMVEKTDAGKYRLGDIVVFRKNGLLVTHRIIGKREYQGRYYFLEKGDADLQTNLLPIEDIIGRVNSIKKAKRTIRTTSGTGRLLQLTLSCISYTAIQGWKAVEYCLTLGRRYTANHRCRNMYSRVFSVLRGITVRIL